MDYCLDSGDGTASIWTGAFDIDVDGDGELDGVRLDFDGDGVFDDALADFDADGLADHAALDLDDDGLPESRYTDNGSGTWMVGAGISEWGAASGGALRWFGLDGVEHASGADVDGDGDADRLFDMNRDAIVRARPDPQTPERFPTRSALPLRGLRRPTSPAAAVG